MLRTYLHPSTPCLGCPGAHECSDSRRPCVPMTPSKKAKPARDAHWPLMRDDTQWQTQLWGIQPQNCQGSKWQSTRSMLQNVRCGKNSGLCMCWCGCEAAGLLPSGCECSLFAATLKTHEPLPSETTDCDQETGSDSRQHRHRPPDHCSMTGLTPSHLGMDGQVSRGRWADVQPPRDGRAGVTGRAG